MSEFSLVSFTDLRTISHSLVSLTCPSVYPFALQAYVCARVCVCVSYPIFVANFLDPTVGYQYDSSKFPREIRCRPTAKATLQPTKLDEPSLPLNEKNRSLWVISEFFF